jgi:alpha-N-arabinofuranosidase
MLCRKERWGFLKYMKDFINTTWAVRILTMIQTKQTEWFGVYVGAIALWVMVACSAAAQDMSTAALTLRADEPGARIDRNIYGHFSEHLGNCIYGGYWVGEESAIPNTNGIRNDVVEALKAIKVPVLRWPGGCFADEYHWQEGIGPRAQRPAMINTHWGGVTENNHFGTHEFLELCRQLDCEPFINGNVGSGTVQEMSEWVEYVNFDGVSPMSDLRRANGQEAAWRVKYWGVGNESWGCGGNMTPAYYADLYRQFQTYVRSYPEAPVFKIASGPYADNREWMETLMKNVPLHMMQGVDLHYYCGSGEKSRSATEFTEVDWFHQLKRALRIDNYLTDHAAIMDTYDPEKKVALIVGEWGAWHDVEPETNPGFLYQQNSLRDALVAAIHFNIFHKHCDRVRMANIAQTINVLQAMLLVKDEKLVLTPTYHVFEMFKVHHDATSLPVDLKTPDYTFDGESIPMVTASASRNANNVIHLSLVNTSPNASAKIECSLEGVDVSAVHGRLLTAPAINACNTFEEPDLVKPAAWNEAVLTENRVQATIPAKSVVVLEMQ